MKKMPRGKIKVCSFRLDRMRRFFSTASDIFSSIKLIEFEGKDKGMFVNDVRVFIFLEFLQHLREANSFKENEIFC